MNTKLTLIVVAVLVAASLIASAALYARMPDPMPVHWNAAGEVDGYGSRFTGLFLMPLVMVGIVLLMLVIPAIDPLKKNIAGFRGSYNLLFLVLIVYFAYIHGLALASALNVKFNMTTMILPAVALLFFVIGDVLKSAKRNYMVGIRTPWTLASDTVWDETHRVGSILFKIGAGICLLGVFFGENGIWFLLVPALGMTLATIVYSYLVFRREEKKAG